MKTAIFKKAMSPDWWALLARNQQTVFFRRVNRLGDARELAIVESLLPLMDGRQPSRVEAYRDSRLMRLLDYAGKHCSYYRRVFLECGVNLGSPSDLARLPLLDKPTIRANVAGIVSDELVRMDSYGANTGGSTGEPLEFVASSRAGAVDTLHQEYVFRTTMGHVQGDRIAGFGGVTIPEACLKRHEYWIPSGRPDVPYGREVYSSIYLTPETVGYYVDNIFRTQPRILRGYPSFLNDLAANILSRGLEMPYEVKGIQLSAENALGGQVDRIRKAFRAPVFFQYGHSEVSVYAYTKDESLSYVCSPFYGWVEVVDEEGRPVKEGQMGEVVATGFHSRAMPFIRYKTGDLAVYGGCRGGVVRLLRIEGRTQDFVYTADKVKVALTALVFGQHFKCFQTISKWQIYQDTPGKVTMRIVREPGYSDSAESEIRSKFTGYCGIEAAIEYVDAVELSRRGKFRFVVQKVAE